MMIDTLQLEPQCNQRLAALTGQCNEHLHLITKTLGVKIKMRGFSIQFTGDPSALGIAKQVVQSLYLETNTKSRLSLEDVHLNLQVTKSMTIDHETVQSASIKTNFKNVRTRGENQEKYIHNIMTHDISFGIGPAGTGKTYLAVACAVDALKQGNVRRIVLVRPAVEAGESLGFLPGDLAQKVDPYLRPLYDALYEMMGGEMVEKLTQDKVIEVAPLAYMRGRTLNDAFIILDESQNTTSDQMKMFLTRLGFGSKAVITGDLTQTDLTGKKQSGLKHAINILYGIEGISFTYFNSKDVVRHNLVQHIIEAYEKEPQWI